MVLGGKHLKVAANLWLPWVNVTDFPDGSVELSGILGDMLNIVAAMMNFTYSVLKPENQEWGRELPNGSFTGMIGMCQRKEVDLALGPFAMSWDRFQAADFSTTIRFDPYGILVPRPRREVDFTGPARPLAWQVWMSLAIAICISTVIISAVNYLKSHSAMRHNRQEEEELQVSWITRVMFAETVNSLPMNNTGRIFLMSWMIAGLIFHSAYSGVLISLLAVPKVTIPVNSLEDLVSYGKVPWIYPIGTYLHDTLMKGGTGLYKDILDDGMAVVSFYSEREMVKEKRMAVLVPHMSIKKFLHDEYSAHGKCDFYIAKNYIISVPFALAFPKGSHLTAHFNKWINRMKESGMVSDRILSAAKNATACLVPPGKEKGGESDRQIAFTVLDLAGIFLLYGVGMIIGFIMLIVECSVPKWQGSLF